MNIKFTMNMKDQDLKALFEEYNSLPKSPQRSVLGRKIRAEKKRLVDECNYVDIIYVLRFLGDYEKDRLLLDLLKNNPSSSLFVLAFAGSEMNSYSRANDIEKSKHKNDAKALKRDVVSTFDSMLCSFVSSHGSKEDFAYVKQLTDGATWLKSHERSVQGLL